MTAKQPAKPAAPNLGALRGAGGSAQPALHPHHASHKHHPHKKHRPHKAHHKHPQHPVKRGAIAPAIEGCEWVAGYNDHLPTCVATAIANSLLAAAGIRVTDDDVLQLHNLTGAEPVTIARALSALQRYGIGGHKPAAIDYGTPTDTVGALIGITDGLNDHAATYTDRGLIAWGAPLDDASWRADGEAWRIDWLGK